MYSLCEKCLARDDYEKCSTSACSLHESYINEYHKSEIKRLKDALTLIKEVWEGKSPESISRKETWTKRGLAPVEILNLMAGVAKSAVEK